MVQRIPKGTGTMLINDRGSWYLSCTGVRFCLREAVSTAYGKQFPVFHIQHLAISWNPMFHPAASHHTSMIFTWQRCAEMAYNQEPRSRKLVDCTGMQGSAHGHVQTLVGCLRLDCLLTDQSLVAPNRGWLWKWTSNGSTSLFSGPLLMDTWGWQLGRGSVGNQWETGSNVWLRVKPPNLGDKGRTFLGLRKELKKMTRLSG